MSSIQSQVNQALNQYLKQLQSITLPTSSCDSGTYSNIIVNCNNSYDGEFNYDSIDISWSATVSNLQNIINFQYTANNYIEESITSSSVVIQVQNINCIYQGNFIIIGSIAATETFPITPGTTTCYQWVPVWCKGSCTGCFCNAHKCGWRNWGTCWDWCSDCVCTYYLCGSRCVASTWVPPFQQIESISGTLNITIEDLVVNTMLTCEFTYIEPTNLAITETIYINTSSSSISNTFYIYDFIFTNNSYSWSSYTTTILGIPISSDQIKQLLETYSEQLNAFLKTVVLKVVVTNLRKKIKIYERVKIKKEN